MTSKQEIVDFLHDRQSTYTFLSQMYREEVTVDLLKELVTELVQSDLEMEAEDQGYGLLASFARGIQSSDLDLDQVKSALAAEYAGIFLGVKRRNLVPFESVYTSERRLMMQEARDQVVTEYRREGLDTIAGFSEPEDHIAIELAFMGYLCEKAAAALDQDQTGRAQYYLERQRQFFANHLDLWVSRFCEDVLGLAESDFYKGIIMITQEHMSMEADAIEDLASAIAA